MQNINKPRKEGHFLMELVVLGMKVSFICIKSFVLFFLPKRHKSISNDIILITGGGRGLGRVIALEFAKHKPKQIILWGRSVKHLSSTTQEVKCLGTDCTFMSCDVSSKDQIYKNVQVIQETIGDVTILVNNAGIVSGQHIINIDMDDIEHLLRVNMLAHVWTIKSFLPAMMRADRGHIVSISSVLGYMAMSGLSDYCTSKAATTGMMESLSSELEEYPNINLTSIHPYIIANDMFSKLSLRFPNLIPALTEAYVAQRTVNAVLSNTKFVIMPRIINIVLIAQKIFPEQMMLPIYKFLGTHTAMDNFTKSS